MPLRLKLSEDIGDTDWPIRCPHDRFGGGGELPPRWNRLKYPRQLLFSEPANQWSRAREVLLL